ncbi:hypothetical protein K6H10_004454 [Candida tropicalis]
MLFKKRKSNQSGPATPSPPKMKKSRSARDLFHKLSKTPKLTPPSSSSTAAAAIHDPIPLTPKQQTVEEVLLTNIINGRTPRPAPPPPTRSALPYSINDFRQSFSPRSSRNMRPRILDFEIDSLATSTPRGSNFLRRDGVSEYTTDSIFDFAYKSENFHDAGDFIDDKAKDDVLQEEEEEEVDDEEEEDDDFMDLDDYKAASDSYSITDTNIQIFKKYNHERKSQQLQETNTDTKMILIQEKQNYKIKQQQREIKHLQTLLDFQNDLNQHLLKRLNIKDNHSHHHHHHHSRDQRLLPPFHVMRRSNSQKEDQDENISLVSSDSFIMSEQFTSSRSTSIEQLRT